MADSIAFTGNIVDDGGVAIDCKYRGYHVESNTWSNWRDSDSQYYSIDIIDSDWVTKDGNCGNSDHVVIVFDTTEADVLDRKFSVYELALDGSKTYDHEIQIKGCYAPEIGSDWHLSSGIDGTNTFINASDGNAVTNIGRINDPVNAISTFTDEKSYVHGGVTLWHKAVVGGVNVFDDRLGIDFVKYDWTEDGTYVADVAHTYAAISAGADKSQIIRVKVTNKKGNDSLNDRKIQIRYNTPVADIGWDPANPSVNDAFTVTGACTDVDSTITSISWKYDGGEVANNSTLNYSWVQDLGVNYVDAGHTVNADVTWYDGFSTYEITHQEHISMTNLAPSFTLTKEGVEGDEENTFTFTLSNLSDPDGDDGLLEAKWIIEYQTPIDNQFVTIYNPGYPGTTDLTPKTWTFEVSGTYKVSAIVKDGSGLERVVVNTTTVVYGSSCDGKGRIRLNTENGKVRWQMISIPVKNKNIKEYFVDWIDTKIKTYDANKGVGDVIERVTAFPGNLGKSLTFVPGSTPVANAGNFSLVMEDGINLSEILGFWVGIKDYKGITGGDDLIFPWDMSD